MQVRQLLRRLAIVCAVSATTVGVTGCGTFRGAGKDEPPLPPGVTSAELARIRRANQHLILPSAREPARERPRYRGTPPPAPTVISPGPANVWTTGSDLSPASTTSMLVSAWFRCDAIPSAGASYASIVGKYREGAPTLSEWLVGIDANGRLFASTTGAGSPARLTSATSIATGTWNHVCVEWLSAVSVKVYQNGALAASGTLAPPALASTPVVVGDVYPASGGHALSGAVDEIRIWQKAATPEVVTALFTNAPDADGDGIMNANDPDDNNDGLPDAWANQYFGDPMGGNPNGDFDKDGMTDLEEYICGSDPTDKNSQFFMGPLRRAGTGSTWVVECDGEAGRLYQLWSRPALLSGGTGWTAMGSAAACLQSGLLQIPVTSTTNSTCIYRVTVRLP